MTARFRTALPDGYSQELAVKGDLKLEQPDHQVVDLGNSLARDFDHRNVEIFKNLWKTEDQKDHHCGKQGKFCIYAL